jgi:hypothetical protein
MGAVTRGGDRIADLHLRVGDDDAVDEQFDEVAPLGERRLVEPDLDGGTEGGEAGRHAGEVALLLGTGFELALLRPELLIALPQFLLGPLELSQLDDAIEIGGEQPLALARHLAARRPDGGEPGLEFLRHPVPALRAGKCRREAIGRGDERDKIGPNQRL